MNSISEQEKRKMTDQENEWGNIRLDTEKVKLQFEALLEVVDNLKAENARLREALEFYSNKDNWKSWVEHADCFEPVTFTSDESRCIQDEGNKAREALKQPGTDARKGAQ